MGAPRLGKINLRWCLACNVPILDRDTCGICQEKTKNVSITPPGDIRPGMKAELKLIRELIDLQFGPGSAERVVPDDKVAVLNGAPSDDHMDEVIVDGIVIGALKFDLRDLAYRFLPRPRAVKYMKDILKSWVVVDDGAVQPILKSSNLLNPGVIEAEQGIKKGDEVVLLTTDRKPLAVGVAKSSGEEMNLRGRGVGVKVRWREEPGLKEPLPGGQDWELVIKANDDYLKALEAKAVDFVKRTVEEYSDKITAVSYSGGKDSLVTLHLVLRAGINPKILFVDTGLEFPETVENVKVIVEKYKLELLEYNAGDAFWHSMKHYGPPGRDYRWCCKSCKLGPAAILIKRKVGKDVLSFIGQRGKESEQRFHKRNIWENPWVPGQLGASPIQKWNALEVWLHIFKYDLPYNPLYDQGLVRIGCWLCPSQSLSELDLVSRHPDHDLWVKGLEEFAKKRGLKEPWHTYGLSRWNKLPGKMKVFLNEKGIEVTSEGKPVDRCYIDDTLKLSTINEKDGGFEGRFSEEIDLESAAHLLNILGPVEMKDGFISITRGEGVELKVYPDRVTAGGKNAAPREVKRAFETVYRTIYCVSCGVCIGRCPQDALSIQEESRKVKLDPEQCIQCGICIGKCPVIEFPPR